MAEEGGGRTYHYVFPEIEAAAEALAKAANIPEEYERPYDPLDDLLDWERYGRAEGPLPSGR